MLSIEYLGHSAFLLRSEEGRFVTDPFDEIGYEMPKVKAQFVTVSHGHYDHCNAMAVQGVEEVFTEAYSYLGGVVEGFSTWHDDKGGAIRGANTLFKLRLGGVTLCHMGDIGELPTPEILQFLHGVDVLLIPVGGVYTINAAGAKAYVDAVKPKIVIPMHYYDEESTIDIHPVEEFLSLFPKEKVSLYEGKYQIEEEELQSGAAEAQIVVLTRRK
ncbi:MAG: MBL fold metallo-hydrolase [Clostridia bacterium]|nr:MBL fold metallo-hydrolase [Clostridia bacterium]